MSYILKASAGINGKPDQITLSGSRSGMKSVKVSVENS